MINVCCFVQTNLTLRPTSDRYGTALWGTIADFFSFFLFHQFPFQIMTRPPSMRPHQHIQRDQRLMTSMTVHRVFFLLFCFYFTYNLLLYEPNNDGHIPATSPVSQPQTSWTTTGVTMCYRVKKKARTHGCHRQFHWFQPKRLAALGFGGAALKLIWYYYCSDPVIPGRCSGPV